MSKDLTRWNRAGLSRFRYVDGNAVTYLEALRQEMKQAFTDAGGELQWEALDTALPEVPGETPAERLARWLAQYRSPRRDYGWEIMRAYARATHVLTEYLDAYANESYLGTATQWDNVRRLVEMLDYHPAPPASAQTVIALLAKEDASGTIATGFQVKNQPDDGSAPVIFETLEDADVDWQLSLLRPLNWDKSQKLLVSTSTGGGTGNYQFQFPLEEPLDGVSAGTLGVFYLEGAPGGDPVEVSKVEENLLHLTWQASDSALFSVARLLLKPQLIQAPRLYGDQVVILTEDHGLSVNSVVAWQVSTNWFIARVEAVEGQRVKLSGNSVPAQGNTIYVALKSRVQALTVNSNPENRVMLPLESQRQVAVVWGENLQTISQDKVHDERLSESVKYYSYVESTDAAAVYYVPEVTEQQANPTVVESQPTVLEFDGKPGDLVSGGWVIVETVSGQHAAQISSVTEQEGYYELGLGSSSGSSTVLSVYGNFEYDIRPAGFDVNEEPVFEVSEQSDSSSLLPLELDSLESVPSVLKPGRQLMVAGAGEVMQVTVQEVVDVLQNEKLTGLSVRVKPALPVPEGASGDYPYTRNATTIYGNVVVAGHGQTQKEKILGSGDAIQSNQSFTLEMNDISFVADATQPSGVRAAVDVLVGGQTWQQVGTLNDSDPEAPDYVVRMNEDRTLAFTFGDGWRGRRLPTGPNNVRVVYRVGVGLIGNLNSGSLVKAVKPHPLIDGVVHPIGATGGNVMESVASMRENAPASILTLGRAVSLSDFTHLTASQSSVWQARAFRRQPGVGRNERIEVAVVPAGGGELGTLEESLRAFLLSNAVPGVEISILLFRSVIPSFTVTVRVKPEQYDPDEVADQVQVALREAFSLKNRKLGEPLYLSQLFQIVEGVEGVENSDCVIEPDGFQDETGAVVEPKTVARGDNDAIRRVSVNEDQVIYLDPERSSVQVTPETFSL